jgi:hypothetical protein
VEYDTESTFMTYSVSVVMANLVTAPYDATVFCRVVLDHLIPRPYTPGRCSLHVVPKCLVGVSDSTVLAL